jgi:hypothetical protein
MPLFAVGAGTVPLEESGKEVPTTPAQMSLSERNPFVKAKTWTEEESREDAYLVNGLLRETVEDKTVYTFSILDLSTQKTFWITSDVDQQEDKKLPFRFRSFDEKKQVLYLETDDGNVTRVPWVKTTAHTASGHKSTRSNENVNKEESDSEEESFMKYLEKYLAEKPDDEENGD